MNNSLAPVLGQLQDGLAEQAKSAQSWRAGALIVATDDVKGATTVSIRKSALPDFMSPEQYDELAQAGLLFNNGHLRKVRVGSTSIQVLDIDFDGLKRAVRRYEQESSQLLMLERENAQLKRRLKVVQEDNLGETAMSDLLQTIREAYLGKNPPLIRPPKFNRTKPGKGQALAGIPTLLLSDWHWGETVDPAQINHLNEFNLEIARKRADRVFNTTLELLFHHQAGQSYDGITVMLGGDMFSGNIHEELRQTNGAPILECVQDLATRLAEYICMVASQFSWVYVPCVPGNHGRLDRKPTAKFAVKDNFDWHLYHMVRAQVEGKLGDKCNVDFDISESLDMRFNLYGTRYLFTHGDQVSGGSGIGGFWPSMMKTAMKKQAREVAAGGEGFDYMVCGHFHKYGAVSNVIVNGSLKGYDEWVYKMNFEHELPIQALWTTHPDYGIIDRRPIYAETPAGAYGSKAQPVTTFRTGLRRVA